MDINDDNKRNNNGNSGDRIIYNKENMYSAAKNDVQRELQSLLDEIKDQQMIRDELQYQRRQNNNESTTSLAIAVAIGAVLYHAYRYYNKNKKTAASSRNYPTLTTEEKDRLRNKRGHFLETAASSLSSSKHQSDSSVDKDENNDTKDKTKNTTSDFKRSKVELTSENVAEIRRRWKREQMTARFPNQKKRSEISTDANRQPDDTSRQPQAQTKEQSDTKKRKKTGKVQLPPPARFLPKLPTTDSDDSVTSTTSSSASGDNGSQMFCQPVNSSPSTQSSSSSVATRNEQFLQTLLLRSLLDRANRSSSTSHRRESTMTQAEKDALVCEYGLTRFLHVRDLPNSAHADFLLNKLAKEFMPIIKRRGYKVLVVSEMCCCTDGLRAARGEPRNSKRIKVHTSSGSEDQCGGYNRTIPLGIPNKNHRNGNTNRSFQTNDTNNEQPSSTPVMTIHQIFIRLRHRTNHYKFRSYEEISKTMSHELAHCEHQNHRPQFYKLMKEIQEEHDRLVVVHQSAAAAGSSGDGNTGSQGESSIDQFGFDIYGTSTSTTRF